MQKASNDLASRIMAGVDKTADGHWFWRDNTNDERTGTIRIGNSSRAVHRVIYELFVGPIAEDHCVKQTCSSLRCCCPEHLASVIWSAAVRKRKREAAAALANNIPAKSPAPAVTQHISSKWSERRWDRKYKRVGNLL